MRPHRSKDRHYPAKTAFVREQLRGGRRASELANQLYREGTHSIQIVLIFHQATGASIADLTAFGSWWGRRGVTDAHAFDEWAREVFGDPPRLR
ncbi:hypothetical protein [Variovorax sp. dw_954]|uniref:hypothetical protein n=1 Tax=Variovorax sp. dw_954 TaxID=2720078 RepID=UPI001BD67C6A|nr:hypothetical protein [Variovorax sp. dw_954]